MNNMVSGVDSMVTGLSNKCYGSISTTSSPGIMDHRVSKPSKTIIKSNMTVSEAYITATSKAAPIYGSSNSVWAPDYMVSGPASKVPLPQNRDSRPGSSGNNSSKQRDTVPRLCNTVPQPHAIPKLIKTEPRTNNAVFWLSKTVSMQDKPARKSPGLVTSSPIWTAQPLNRVSLSPSWAPLPRPTQSLDQAIQPSGLTKLSLGSS